MPLFNVEMEVRLVQLYEEYQVDIEEPFRISNSSDKSYTKQRMKLPQISGKRTSRIIKGDKEGLIHINKKNKNKAELNFGTIYNHIIMISKNLNF
jgi:glutamyl/glutaminyl-tRNA synthetase